MITPIDFDHEAYLGHTIEAIASEKGRDPEARRSGRVRAAASGSVSRASGASRGVGHVPVTRAADFEIRDLHIDARGADSRG